MNKSIAFLFYITAAAIQDLRQKKVSNRWIFVGAAAGTAAALTEGGIKEAGGAALAFFFPVLLFYLLFRMRVLGAADLKLWGVSSVWFGVWAGAEIAVLSLVLSAAAGGIQMAVQGDLKKKLQQGWSYLCRTAVSHKLTAYPEEEEPVHGKSGRIPLVPFIGIASLLWLWKEKRLGI